MGYALENQKAGSFYSEEEGKWMQAIFPSSHPAGRKEVDLLRRWLDDRARRATTADARAQVARIAFREVLRQVATSSVDRAMILQDVWDMMVTSSEELHPHNALIREHEVIKQQIASATSTNIALQFKLNAVTKLRGSEKKKFEDARQQDPSQGDPETRVKYLMSVREGLEERLHDEGRARTALVIALGEKDLAFRDLRTRIEELGRAMVVRPPRQEADFKEAMPALVSILSAATIAALNDFAKLRGFQERFDTRKDLETQTPIATTASKAIQTSAARGLERAAEDK
jgi:hypothetical protein